MTDTHADLQHRLRRLERQNRVVLAVAILAIASGVWTVAAPVEGRAARAAPAGATQPVADIMRVRELDVVDGNGVTRVKIGAPLPHAVVNGRQNSSRGGRPEDTISDMLLFDTEGVERSGYATVDRGYSNVLLTLDDKNRQHAMFIAEPTGATTLRLFNADTKDRVDVAVDDQGPSIAMIRRGKQIYHFPPE